MELKEGIYSMSDKDYLRHREIATSVSKVDSIALIEKAQSDFKIKIYAGDLQMSFAPLDEKQRVEAQVESVKGVAIVDFIGTMTSGRNWWSYSTYDLVYIIQDLGTNVNVTSVLMKVNTNGGQLGGLEALFNTIKNFKDEYGKDFIILVTENCESAGVWAFCGANKVYLADKICSMGSIGVQSIFIDDSIYLEKNGLKEVRIRASQSVNKNIEIDELEKGNYERTIKRLSVKAQVMIDTVKLGRGEKLNTIVTKSKHNPNDIPDIFTGLSYIGEDAVKMGLADGIKSEKEILKMLLSGESFTEIEPIDNDLLNIENTNAMSNSKDSFYAKVKALFETAGAEETVQEAAQVETPNFADMIKQAAEAAATATEAKLIPRIEAANTAATEASNAAKVSGDELAAAQKEIERLKVSAQSAAVVVGANPSAQAANVVIEENPTKAFTTFAAGNISITEK